ncbi:hypothetical protein MHK_010249, partial [Candidatus Magnetomorum sp. HK-1]
LMKYDQQGSLLNDYVVLVNTDGYPEFMRNNKKAGDFVEVILKKEKNDTIEGKIETLNFTHASVYLFYENGKFAKFSKVNMGNGNFTISGLNQNTRYKLYFAARISANKYVYQWSGINNIGVNSKNQAIFYGVPANIYFQFDQTLITFKNDSNPAGINEIYSTTQSFRMLRNKRADDN